MSYVIRLSKSVKKFLRKLPKETSVRITTALKRCKIRPYSHVKKLVNSPYFSFRVGDYRALMRIQDNELQILVVEIDHRKKVYK